MSENRRIIERVRAGHIEDYSSIIRQYQYVVWKIAAFALRDVGATEDLVQQVFVNAYLKLDQYDIERDFGVWIRTIARNEVRKALRHRVRQDRKLAKYQQWLEAHLDLLQGDELPDDHRREALKHCRELLPPPAREALLLRYEQAQNFEQIATALGRTVAAARQLLSRARTTLRQCIEKRTAHS